MNNIVTRNFLPILAGVFIIVVILANVVSAPKPGVNPIATPLPTFVEITAAPIVTPLPTTEVTPVPTPRLPIPLPIKAPKPTPPRTDTIP